MDKSSQEWRYEQGKYALRSVDDRFCCLGVLCDLYQKETGEGSWKTGIKGQNYLYVYEGQNHFLPSGVCDWAGIENENGHYYKSGSGSSLTDQNDSGCSFNAIAKIIEEIVDRL